MDAAKQAAAAEEGGAPGGGVLDAAGSGVLGMDSHIWAAGYQLLPGRCLPLPGPLKGPVQTGPLMATVHTTRTTQQDASLARMTSHR